MGRQCDVRSYDKTVDDDSLTSSGSEVEESVFIAYPQFDVLNGSKQLDPITPEFTMPSYIEVGK